MISDYFTDVVTIITRVYDEWNNATDTNVDYDCRVDYTDRIIKSPDGDDRQASYRIYLKPGIAVTMSDRIQIKKLRGTLTNETQTFSILSITKHADFSGHHVRVTV